MNAGLKEHGPIRCTNNHIHLELSNRFTQPIDKDKISVKFPYFGAKYPTSLTSSPELTLSIESENNINANPGTIHMWKDYLGIRHNVTVGPAEYVHIVFPLDEEVAKTWLYDEVDSEACKDGCEMSVLFDEDCKWVEAQFTGVPAVLRWGEEISRPHT